MSYPYPTLVNRKPLVSALGDIAARFNLNVGELIAYANEDKVGGYHHEEELRQWPGGSVWGAEGQVIYALVRALRPTRVLEIGSWNGCSAHHIAAALATNGDGKLTCIDTEFKFAVPDEYDGVMKLIEGDLFDYTWPRRGKYNFVFADANATHAQIAHIWQSFQKYANDGAMIVNHDAAHFVVGERVADGIKTSGVDDYIVVAIAPADCGLAIWQK